MPCEQAGKSKPSAASGKLKKEEVLGNVHNYGWVNELDPVVDAGSHSGR